MYEDITYESILKRMLDRVPGNLDKREGSIIYDALAPAAIELVNMYIELEGILNETFADTASRAYLIKRVAERGLTPYPATNAILKGVFLPASVDVTGQRFNIGTLNYIVLEKISDSEYRVKCEEAGEIGNRYFGQMIPIDYIEGLERAELIEVLIPGEDEEDTEALRKRYIASFNSQAYGGNIQDYKDKINAMTGVGGVKVYPVWNGGGTVKLVIINSSYAVPSEDLVSQVQTAVDPTENAGEGVGIAPIGHVVTVKGVEEFKVNIKANIDYADNWSRETAMPYIEAAVDDYFKDLAKTWADEQAVVVRISQLESRILACAGVLDIRDTTINDLAENATLPEEQIPVRGLIEDE